MPTADPGGGFTVGILDSGVGGFSVVREIVKRFPDLSFVYVADTAHVPYSGKSPEELVPAVGRILRFFLNQGMGAVIFACNTSSSLVLPRIRPSFPVPVYGVVEPAVAAAVKASAGKGIGAAANEVTAKSGMFGRLIREKNKNIPVYEFGCPLLVPLVESGDVHSDKARGLVENYCRPLRGKIDTLILGCTHFPYLEGHFRESLPGVRLIDPAVYLADELVGFLKLRSGKGPARRRLYATKENSPHVSLWAGKILGWNAPAEFLSLDTLEPWKG